MAVGLLTMGQNVHREKGQQQHRKHQEVNEWLLVVVRKDLLPYHTATRTEVRGAQHLHIFAQMHVYKQAGKI